jgi:tyrosinase
MGSKIMLTRRSALLGTATVTALLLAQVKKGWAAPPTVRPDIASPAGQRMAEIYGAAVQAMQDPAINYPPQPQSWTFQAYMHAVPRNPFDPANSGGIRGTDLKTRIDQMYGQPAANTSQAAWKNAALQCWATCQHSSPYFTTWHRWYLYYFERICRKMSNQPDFVLPYWNYASDSGSSLQLPSPFTDVPAQGAPQNVLFFDDRGLGFADGQATGPQNVAMNEGGFMPFSLTQYGPALSTKEMFPSDDRDHISVDPTDPVYLALGFSGRLECVPHDNVHVSVGGWMQNVPSAAGDPIFFMHHCQIDRLYASWEAQPGVSYNFGNSPSQPDETTWKTVKTGSFVDENGQLATVKLGGAIDISALNYSYDKLAPAAAPELTAVLAARVRPATRLKIAAMEAPKFAVQSGGTTVILAPAAAATAATAAPTTNNAPVGAPQTLVLKGVRLLRRPRAPLSVFVNLPKGTAPRLNDPYYIGTLNLFNFDLGTGVAMDHTDDGMNADHKMPGSDLRFDVTDVLQRQRARGQWDGGAITVTISTIGADSPGAVTYVTIDGITLVP